jgi:hypothetical protein
MTKFLIGAMFIGVVLGAVGVRRFAPAVVQGAPAQAQAERVFLDKVKGVGYVRLPDKRFVVTLSDGRQVQPLLLLNHGNTWEAQISKGEWVRSAE